MLSAPIRKVALLATISACFCFGYIRQYTSDSSPIPLFRSDNAAIPFALNQSVVAGLQSSLSGKNVTVISAHSDPVAAVRASMATWNSVPTANVHFQPLQSTSAGIVYQGCGDTNVINVAADSADLSAVGGALAVTASYFYNSGGLGSCGAVVAKGAIQNSNIIVNPAYPFSTDGSTSYDLQSVITHELGHALGSSHSSLIGTNMFWANSNQRLLSSDEVAFLSTAYPPASGGLAVGTLGGTVTAGGQPVAFALISMIDPAAGISCGTLTAADGTYSVQAPPGSYQLIVEPLTGVIKPGNLYLTAAQATASAAIAFQPTLASGLAVVTAGGKTTANVSVTTGTTTFAIPIVTTTAVNAQVSSAFIGGPAVVPSGQSVDLVLDGAGFDSSLSDSNVQVFGPGISVKPGSVRVDPTNSYDGVPILRITLNVAASPAQYLASVFISKGANSYSLTGGLIVTPPTPAFTSKSVVNAASYTGANGNGAVSPGGIYSLYATNGTSTLGPATPVGNGGYDAYNLLPTSLGGVSVTFDGIPAPLFFVYSGQINFQAPFELAGKTSTQVVVNYLGSASPAVTVPVLPAQPAFFTITPTGTDSIAVNQDGKLNSAQNPEARGNYVTIYGTGVGAIGCATATGAGAAAGCSAKDTVTIAGLPASGQYFFPGLTPTAVGLAQWTVQIPANAPTGAQTVIATDTATGLSTPKGTLYIK